MSCPSEPTTNDIGFKCYGKGPGSDRLCEYYFWVSKDKARSSETRCETCVTIEGVIRELEFLVYREPWWQTEGKDGESKKETWELGGLFEEFNNQQDQHSGEGSLGDGMTSKERADFRRKMKENFQSSQGNGFTEEDMASTDAASQLTLTSGQSTLVGSSRGQNKSHGDEEIEVDGVASEMVHYSPAAR